ncbi:solute carrier family 23 member 2-like isoform X4 [Mytilus galloprovincialis]|uniref:solute carrier family 23 member 2-like isoform X4 n=1 Tax=Mytilus galloprovincialis TaxID=29158 RepID=UPI003F7C1FE2
MEGRRTLSGLQYKVEDNPTWITTVFLAFQHYLMLLSSNLATPGLVAITICAQGDVEVASILLGNMLFACGICTVIQFFFGVRLPIVQCPQYAYVVPAIVLTSFDEWKCPDISVASSNASNVVISNFTLGNFTDINDQPYWQQRLNMITGSLMVASVFEIILGASGILTILLRFIGPLTVAPTIMMMGLGVLQPGYELAGSHWGIAFGTMAMIVMLSECIPKFNVSLPCHIILTAKQEACTKKQIHKKTEIVAHKMFSVIISVSVMWLLCYILTITDVFPDGEDVYGYHARTDVRDKQLKTAPWFSFPYPGKFGMPTFNSGLLIAFIGGVFTSTIESIGDYYTCARIAGAVPPPPSAVNRGILIEGIDCIIAASVGAGFGVTSCSQNIGAISLTKVGSRRVVLVAGILMMIFGCFNKFSTLMVTIPDPIVGASFIVLFGTDHERGILSWRELTKEHLDDKENFSLRTYDLPFGMSKIKSWSWARYIPFSPTFKEDKCGPCTKSKGIESIGEEVDMILSDNCGHV